LETAGILETLVLSQLRSIIQAASKIAAYRNSNVSYAFTAHRIKFSTGTVAYVHTRNYILAGGGGVRRQYVGDHCEKERCSQNKKEER
jgi:hypothetical protein